MAIVTERRIRISANGYAIDIHPSDVSGTIDALRGAREITLVGDDGEYKLAKIYGVYWCAVLPIGMVRRIISILESDTVQDQADAIYAEWKDRR